MARGIAAKAPEEGGEIDLTPMLDVVFIMLIFFIVTAVFIKEPGIQIDRTGTQVRDLVANQSILIAINDRNEIWLDRKKIDERSVKSRIERMLVDNPLGAVVIQQSKGSNADYYAKVYDAAKAAGAVEIYLSTDPK